MKFSMVFSLIIFVVNQVTCNGERFGCPSPDVNSYTKVKYKSKGRIARFSCLPGHMLFGKKAITCVRNHWNSEPPICAASGCRPFDDPENGKILRIIPYAVEGFECNPNFKLHGNKLVYCDGKNWNGTMPHCVGFKEKHEENTFCGFETKSLCGWTHGLNQDYPWRRVVPQDVSGDGPSADHTHYPDDTGYFLYARFPGDGWTHTSRLFSPIVTPDKTIGCILFYYFFSSNNTGHLTLYTTSMSNRGSDLKVVKNISNNSEMNTWMMGSAVLPRRQSQYQVVLEASGGAELSYFAVDDIWLISEGNCPSVIPDYEPERTTTNTEDMLPSSAAYESYDPSQEEVPSSDAPELQHSSVSEQETTAASPSAGVSITWSTKSSAPIPTYSQGPSSTLNQSQPVSSSQTPSVVILSSTSNPPTTTQPTATTQTMFSRNTVLPVQMTSRTLSTSPPTEGNTPQTVIAASSSPKRVSSVSPGQSTMATTWPSQETTTTPYSSGMTTTEPSSVTIGPYIGRKYPNFTSKRPLVIQFLPKEEKALESLPVSDEESKEISTCFGRCGESATELSCGCEDHCMALASCCTDFMVMCYSQSSEPNSAPIKGDSGGSGVAIAIIIVISCLVLLGVVILAIKMKKAVQRSAMNSYRPSSDSPTEENRVSVHLRNSTETTGNLVFQGFAKPWIMGKSEDSRPILDED